MNHSPFSSWKWQHNLILEFDATSWTAPDFNDSAWPVKHVVRDTWSSIGHHLTMTDAASGRSGRMAYRTTQRLGTLPEGKRAYLWIGSTDGSARVYVNGRLVPFSVTAGGMILVWRDSTSRTRPSHAGRMPRPPCGPRKARFTTRRLIASRTPGNRMRLPIAGSRDSRGRIRLSIQYQYLMALTVDERNFVRHTALKRKASK